MPSICKSLIVIGPLLSSTRVIVDPDNVAVIFKAVEFIAVTNPDRSLLGKSTEISTDVELSERLNV